MAGSSEQHVTFVRTDPQFTHQVRVNLEVPKCTPSWPPKRALSKKNTASSGDAVRFSERMELAAHPARSYLNHTRVSESRLLVRESQPLVRESQPLEAWRPLQSGGVGDRRRHRHHPVGEVPLL